MLIESRKGNAKMTVVLWLIIPATLIIHSLLYSMGLSLITIAFFSAIAMFIGVPVYLGYNIMAGFNMMSDKELKQYDMEGMSRFIGLSFIFTAFISFFATLMVLILTDNDPTATGIGVILWLIVLIPIFYASGERFKVKSSRR